MRLFLKSILTITACVFFFTFLKKEQNILCFQMLINSTEEGKPIVLFNNQELIPPFSPEISDYKVYRATTIFPNTIQVGNEKKAVLLNKIARNEQVKIKINDKKYTIHLYPDDMPSFYFEKHNPQSNNHILVSPFHPEAKHPSFLYIITENGNFIYYQRSQNNKILSDFKQTVLPNGEKVYSYMQQERPVPPYHYLSGELVVLNDKFEQIKKLKIKETDKHPELMIENHDSLILDKNHYVLTAYYDSEIFHPKTGEPILVTQTVIQEIKDGKVVFDWMSSDHPQLYTYFKYPNKTIDKKYHDYMHFNSIIIDPTDGHFIASFASQSAVIKINRKTGKIMWIMGGLGDEFNMPEKYRFYGQHSLSITKDGYLMLFDNQSPSFAARIMKNFVPHKKSRVLKFKLDEKHKKVLDVQEIILLFHTDTMGSVYETDKNTYLISHGNYNRVSKISVSGSKATILWEILLFGMQSMPTYRAYEVKALQ